jgi:hypothetical protein
VVVDTSYDDSEFVEQNEIQDHVPLKLALITSQQEVPGDRGGVTNLSVSGDNFDLVVVDPHDPSTTSETQSANAIAEPSPNGYQPCRRKISLITKINSCTQSKNKQESMASNLNITQRWSLQYTKEALCDCSVVAVIAKANL